MPILRVDTNVSIDKVPQDFKAKATRVVADTLGKPDAYVAIQLNAGQNLSFGASEEPTALCDLVSIGSLSVESNKKHSAAIMSFLQQTLSVPPSRVYICFKNINKADCGFNNTTFDDLL